MYAIYKNKYDQKDSKRPTELHGINHVNIELFTIIIKC